MSKLLPRNIILQSFKINQMTKAEEVLKRIVQDLEGDFVDEQDMKKRYHLLPEWYDEAKDALAEAAAPQATPVSGMRWVKASKRLPELPNPLPPDTEDEKGVLFVNRTHSCGSFWYPSYGQPPSSVMNLQFDGWSLEQWEWLEEETAPVSGMRTLLEMTDEEREEVKAFTPLQKQSWNLHYVADIIEAEKLIDWLRQKGFQLNLEGGAAAPVSDAVAFAEWCVMQERQHNWMFIPTFEEWRRGTNDEKGNAVFATTEQLYNGHYQLFKAPLHRGEGGEA